jgi:hypothetical protein
MAAFLDRSRFDAAQLDSARVSRECLTPHTGKISTALINNPFGKKCLVSRAARRSSPIARSRRAALQRQKQH